MPGHAATAWVSIARDLVGGCVRWLIGLRSIVSWPWLAAASVPTDDVHRAHVGVLGHDRRGHFLLVRNQSVVRHAFGGLGRARAAGRCHRSGRVPWGSHRTASPVATRIDRGEHERRRPVLHHPGEAALVGLQRTRRSRAPSMLYSAAVHARPWSERRNRLHSIGVSVSDTNARDEDRHADRDRELVEQLPDDPAHEQERDEHRGERQRHREDREADFRRAVERGLHRRLPHLEVADDVLEHHDRVVDHEPDGERQRHERQVVEAVVQQVHHRERADDRHRQREARDDRRRDVAQEQEDHEHDEHQRQHRA